MNGFIKLFFYTVFSLSFLFSYGQSQKQLCITIDDIPAVTYGRKAPAVYIEITQKLIGTFEKYNIPAMGFAVGQQLHKNGELNPEKIAILKMWLDGGYDLGNHTFAHSDYNKVGAEAYFEDILKGEKGLKNLLNEYGKTLTYFRHPYLRSGTDAAKYDTLNSFLTQHGYQVSPVTIDNDEYLFAKAYHDMLVAKNDHMMKYVGACYIEYMEKKLLYFEKKSEEVFGRQIAQTLLIHGNQLNADYLGELAEMFQRNGYTFVSQETVLKDPAYSEPVTNYMKRGHSWIFRWGMSKGFDETLMEGDIEVPHDILQLLKM